MRYRATCIDLYLSRIRLFADAEGRNYRLFFVNVVRVADDDSVLADRLLFERNQVRTLAVFFRRERQIFEFVGFGRTKGAGRGDFCLALLLVGTEAENLDDGHRVGLVVYRLDDEIEFVGGFELRRGFYACLLYTSDAADE